MKNSFSYLLICAALAACTPGRAAMALRQCEFRSPSGAVDLDKPRQQFGRLSLVVLNNRDQAIKSVIVDITPWAPSWMFWIHRDQLLHHRVSIRGAVRAHAVATLRHELTSEDYLYLVDIKWETDCAIVSALFADGTVWKKSVN